jgi:threonine/homoserine/homoserine lactone efflux protein
MYGALLAGIFAGFAIAVPVGVIAVLIIETGMIGGLRRGLAAGAGAATVDLLYCASALALGGLISSLLAFAIVPLQLKQRRRNVVQRLAWTCC